MKICPKCKSQHDKTGVYCSRSCANSRTFSEESKQRKSKAAKQYWDSLLPEEQQSKINLLAEVKSSNKYSSPGYLTYIFTENWDTLGIEAKRLKVILEQQGKCNKCEVSSWNGQQITLEFEHKDGDNSNNSRDNVEALCPNCHSQTATWRGRKNKGKQKRIEFYITLFNQDSEGNP